MYLAAIASMCCFTSRPNCRSASCRSSSSSASTSRMKLSSGNFESTGTVRSHDCVHPLAGVERVLHLVGGRRQPVAEQVLEQKLAEATARFRGPEGLLQ